MARRIVAFCFCCAFATSVFAGETAQEVAEAARKLAASRQHAEAAPLFEKAAGLETDAGKRGKLRLEAAGAYASAGDLDKAWAITDAIIADADAPDQLKNTAVQRSIDFCYWAGRGELAKPRITGVGIPYFQARARQPGTVLEKFNAMHAAGWLQWRLAETNAALETFRSTFALTNLTTDLRIRAHLALADLHGKCGDQSAVVGQARMAGDLAAEQAEARKIPEGGDAQVLARTANAKAAAYVTAARNYEVGDLFDRADAMYAKAAALPGLTEERQADNDLAITDSFRKRKDFDKAIAAAERVLARGDDGQMSARKTTARQRIAAMRNDLGDKEGALAMYFEAAAKAAGSPYVKINEIKRICDEFIKDKRQDAALALCDRVVSLQNIDPGDTAWAYLKQSQVLLDRKEFDQARAAAEKALALNVANGKAILAIYATYKARPLPQKRDMYRYIEETMAGPVAESLTRDEIRDIWSTYGFDAHNLFDHDKVRKAFAELDRHGIPYGGYMGLRCLPALKIYKDFATFPKDEKEIRFPQNLADLGVKDVKTVNARDFADGARNDTECLQRAIDSDATTIVIEDKGVPWTITRLEMKSNKRLLLRKGVKIISDKSEENYHKTLLFDIRRCENVIIEGEGEVGDVYIGKYKDDKERDELCKKYGGSVFGLTETTNIVIRNVTVANSAQDGIFFGGLGLIPTRTYLENVVLDHHYRQAMSICNADEVYCKNVTFSNTRGAAPSAGIDLEPPIECSPDSSIYLFDCTFDNNAGGGLVFATSTMYPVTLHAKRCHFKAQSQHAVDILARCGVYLGSQRKAPAKIIFEECDFESYSDVSPLCIQTCSLFDVWFRNCTIRDIGRKGPANRAYTASPLVFRLSRDFGKDGIPEHMLGLIHFENVKIEGYGGQPFASFADELGMLDIKGILKGTVDFNGKQVDVSQYEYTAPDRHEIPAEQVDLKTLLKPAKIPTGDMPVSNGEISWNGAWYQKAPEYTYYFWAEQGRKVSLTLRYPAWLKRVAGERLLLKSVSGRTTEVGELQPGVNPLAFTVPETGWHCFMPPCQAGEGASCHVTDVKGVHLAYQGDTRGISLSKFVFRDPGRDYTGYFEVPAGGRECRLRITFGSLELRNPAGDLVGSIRNGEYHGRHTFTIKPGTDKAEIWSFTAPAGGGNTHVLRFYAPLNGIWADSPDVLPLQFADHHVPPRAAAASAVSPEDKPVALTVDRSVLTGIQRKVLDEAITARKALAGRREWAARLDELERKIADLRLRATSDAAQREVEDVSKNLIPLQRMAAIEAQAAKESDSLRELAAFCQVFAPVIVLPLPQVADYVAWKASGKNLEKSYPALYHEIATVRFKDNLEGALKQLGLGLVNDTVEYADARHLALLRDRIMEILGKK